MEDAYIFKKKMKKSKFQENLIKKTKKKFELFYEKLVIHRIFNLINRNYEVIDALIRSICFPTYFLDIRKIEHRNMDVFVKLEDDGYSYVVVVATANNIEYLMNKEKINW